MKTETVKSDEKLNYWSYQGGRMYVSEDAVTKSKKQSLKTYNDFISGDFDLSEILTEDLIDEVIPKDSKVKEKK